MENTGTVVTAKRIDAINAPQLEIQLKTMLEQDIDEIIVDMIDTTYISSMGLRVFLTAQKKIRAKGGSMVLKHVSDQVMEVFDVTGFSGLLTFGED